MLNDKYLSDTEIDQLIHSPKYFKAKPKKPVEVNQNISQSFNLYSCDDSVIFSVFISYSKRMPQDFSIGLMYEGMLLFRCNGFHGTTRAGFFSTEHHAYPHAHKLTSADIDAGREKKPSCIMNLTGEYVDLKTAILFFLQTMCYIGL